MSDADLRLHLYADDALDADAARELETDLAARPDLRERLDEIRLFQRHLAAQLDAVAPAPVLVGARRTRLLDQVADLAGRRRQRRWWVVARYAAAASLVIGALGIGAVGMSLTTYRMAEPLDDPAVRTATLTPAPDRSRYSYDWEDGAGRAGRATTTPRGTEGAYGTTSGDGTVTPGVEKDARLDARIHHWDGHALAPDAGRPRRPTTTAAPAAAEQRWAPVPMDERPAPMTPTRERPALPALEVPVEEFSREEEAAGLAKGRDDAIATHHDWELAQALTGDALPDPGGRFQSSSWARPVKPAPATPEPATAPPSAAARDDTGGAPGDVLALGYFRGEVREAKQQPGLERAPVATPMPVPVPVQPPPPAQTSGANAERVKEVGRRGGVRLALDPAQEAKPADAAAGPAMDWMRRSRELAFDSPDSGLPEPGGTGSRVLPPTAAEPLAQSNALRAAEPDAPHAGMPDQATVEGLVAAGGKISSVDPDSTWRQRPAAAKQEAQHLEALEKAGSRNGELQHIAQSGRHVAGQLDLKLSGLPDDLAPVAGDVAKEKPDAASTGTALRLYDAKDVLKHQEGQEAQVTAAATITVQDGTTQTFDRRLEPAPEPADWFAALARSAPPAGPVNPWVLAGRDAFSTFSLTADSAAYRLARRCVGLGRLPPPGLVRIEEFINAIDYRWPARGTDTFAVHAEGGPAPFAAPGTALVAIGVKARVLGRDGRLPAHLVLALDTSGSMDRADRLPLLRRALRAMLPTLDPRDRITVVAFANDARLVAQRLPAASAEPLLAAVDGLTATGASNLADGLALAVAQARDAAAPGEAARVVLCSDGVANIGDTEAARLVGLVEDARRAGVSVGTVGVGIGTSDDALLARLSQRGDGNHLRLDPGDEGLAAFAAGFSASLATVARDAKVQVEFDPTVVHRWRQIGWEQRALAREDFRDDTVDAGEIGSGQTATALYELEPLADRDPGRPLGVVRVRWKDAATGAVREFGRALGPDLLVPRPPSQAWRLQLAACAAELAELMRGSEHARDGSFAAVADRLAQLDQADPAVRDLLALARAADGLPRP